MKAIFSGLLGGVKHWPAKTNANTGREMPESFIWNVVDALGMFDVYVKQEDYERVPVGTIFTVQADAFRRADGSLGYRLDRYKLTQQQPQQAAPRPPASEPVEGELAEHAQQ